jgi:TolB-like protein
VPADEPLVTSLARAVLDGTHVDWEAAESGAIADAQPVVQELRVLADLAAVHRRAAAPMPVLARLISALTTDRLPPDLPAEWGHLTILEPIGRGAGGVVYRARDPRLDRDVALKLLPSPLPSDERAASTIIEEGRLLARVRHPNVVTIHGAEQIGDQIGLWMELVHGRTLEDLLGAGAPFSAADVSDIGLQLCGAVSAVHDAGLLHRDIKATNVIRADDGRVVLMDFGTGRDAGDRAASDLTGTPLYLAPEVFRGEPATVQSDIYSLGVVLYHLATGAYPVQGATIGDVRHAHERGERRSLRTARPGLPAGLVRVVERAIDPNPAARYRTAAEMGAGLRAAVRRRAPSARAIVAAVVLAVAAAGIAWSVRGRVTAPAVSHAAGPPRLAVLPFATLGAAGGDDAFGLGLAHEIQRNLARLEGLVLLSFASTPAVPAAQPLARDVRSELRADLILEGSVVRQAGTLRVHARLVRGAGDVELWSNTFDRRDSEVFAILDEIAGAIVNELRLNLRLPRRHETSPETFFLFIRGRAFEARRHETDALEAARLFQEVVDRDPLFAPGWAGLASALAHAHRVRVGDQNEPPPARMEAAASRAIELDELLAPAQAAMGNAYAERRDWPRAEAAFLRALELNPSLTMTHTDYALSVLMPLDRNQDALRLLAEAVSRDPASLDVRRTLAHFQVNAGLYEDAMVSSRWVLERDATFPWASLWLGRALALSGRPDEAVPIFAANPSYWAYLGYAYGVMGRRAEAEALAAAHPDDPRGQMMIYSALGDRNRAIAALERLARRNPWRAATWLHRPEMTLLRSDPRVGAIRARLGL